MRVPTCPMAKAPPSRPPEMAGRIPAVTGQERAPYCANSGGTTDNLFALSQSAQGVFVSWEPDRKPEEWMKRIKIKQGAPPGAPPAAASGPSARDPALDAVRALAIVLVVMTHAASPGFSFPIGSGNWWGAMAWGNSGPGFGPAVFHVQRRTDVGAGHSPSSALWP